MTKREGEGGGEEEEEEEEEERGERTHRCVSRIFLSQLAVPLATVRASFPPSVPRATFFGANERKKTRERERERYRTDNLDLKNHEMISARSFARVS